MKANTKMIKNTGSEFLSGQMEESMKETGKMANNMGWGLIQLRQTVKKKGNGKTEKE